MGKVRRFSPFIGTAPAWQQFGDGLLRRRAGSVIVIPLYLAGMAISGADPAHPTGSAHVYLGLLGIAYSLVFVLAMIRFRRWIAPWPRT